MKNIVYVFLLSAMPMFAGTPNCSDTGILLGVILLLLAFMVGLECTFNYISRFKNRIRVYC